jgi:MoaA/NifB/PqqE/SkfB family radical SAM enzyme
LGAQKYHSAGWGEPFIHPRVFGMTDYVDEQPKRLGTSGDTLKQIVNIKSD